MKNEDGGNGVVSGRRWVLSPGQAAAGTQNAKVIVHPIPDPGGASFFWGRRGEGKREKGKEIRNKSEK
ncbi:hypothetical protein [uncultured Clostridium sp.]|uniref:hypothetical protein n=1 Tax=uncultured Clostridium sp. TaxID=59620 RepID=UPI0025DCF163|nr:hypothetical protein [uncultured Clostridium sp.]